MDVWVLIKAAVLGVVEGLTEFLPISSTGHLIVAASLLNFEGDNGKTFEIAIQSGAMLAVLWEYRRRFIDTISTMASEAAARRFAINVVVAFLPAALAGLLFYKTIKAFLFFPESVAAAFVMGGLIILWVEARHRRAYGSLDLAGHRLARVQTVDDMRALDAFKLGLVQCVAMIPGTSRSGATIIGGMLLGFSRRAATEFSFFLAVPTLVGAGVYAVYKERDGFVPSDWPMFAVGLALAFISALLCIRWLIRYVATHDFTPFAWYRIAFGAVILITAYGGWVQW